MTAPIARRLGAGAAAADAAYAALTAARFAPRLAAHDDALWGDDPAHRAVAANRLGWLESPARMLDEARALAAFAAEVVAEGFTHAVLLGMGGSSLAPEVLRSTLGRRADRLELTVLDNTSPAAVRAALAAHDLSRTLCIVSSKSGGTIEVVSFERTFWAAVHAVRGAGTGRAFVAITDPGTGLAELAARRGYRRVFTNPADIGGRYSALSYFGLVPAALIGADIAALAAAAAPERAALAGESPAVALGATLGALAREGRDKLTLVMAPELAALGVWIEQLVAESTGKSGRGIVPVDDEPRRESGRYASDRVFVASGPLPAETREWLDALAAAGHPVLHWNASAALLGAEFMRWEIATVAAAAVLGVDPFDEPNVAEAKAATQQVLEAGAAESPPRARAGALAAYAPETLALAGTAAGDWLRALLAGVRPGDYLALLAYVARDDARHRALQQLREALGVSSGVATTLGYGPRFLHSTGQLHKGGAANGVFLQLTADEGDLAIPGAAYGFAALRAAQAAGDYQVLVRRGRRVLRVDLGHDIERSLAELVAGFTGR